ncbi:lipase esterase protein [Rutstroemia sp. NJR-2017a WRK4]|nr:lipase esterase protein [Rutstroemia sp. NJR-2017a WRK4]
MDISPIGIAKVIIPNLPLILKTAVLALLARSPNASVQDVITEIIVVSARPMLATPAPILKSQIQSQKDWGVWGPMWIARYTIPCTGPGFLSDSRYPTPTEALRRAIEYFGNKKDALNPPRIVDVEAEWTGYRGGVSAIARRPDLPEYEQYNMLMEEVDQGGPTMLYFHGGAFCLMDPVTHRYTTSALARETRGRCFSIRYRLAPQNPFPAALLDAFVAYLSLISPPAGAFHTPVPPSNIVLSGDSSGAGLATSLHLLLSTLPRICINRLSFGGRDVSLSANAVAGLAITSPWLDVSRSLPSVLNNVPYDIIAPPSLDYTITHPNFPVDSVWPTSPPRVETYCEATMVTHPLVSPLAARTEHWRDGPPIYVSIGWESMQDEAEVFARRAYLAGNTVIFDGYVGMPHCFAMMPWNEAGRTAFNKCASFCKAAVEGSLERREFATWTDKHGLIRRVKMSSLGMRNSERRMDLDDELVDRLLENQRGWRVDLEQRLRGSGVLKKF